MMNLPFEVLEAAIKSYQTRSITPIVKEELKLKIQASRLAAGKEELPKPVFKEPQKYQLTEEEEEKRRVKRERNRIAAEKCRKKKKMMGDSSSQELQALQQRNSHLKSQVKSLENELSKFRASLASAGIELVRVPQEIPDIAVPSTSTTPSPYPPQYSPAISPCGSQSDFDFQSPSPGFTQATSPVFTQVSSPDFTQVTSPSFTQATSSVFTQAGFSYENTEYVPQGSNVFQFDPYMTPQWPPQLCADQEQQHLPETVTLGDCFLENESADLPNIEELNQFVVDETEAQVPGPQLDFTTDMPSFY